MIVGGNKEDEDNERRAREKLLARRNAARTAASSATQIIAQRISGESSKSRKKQAKFTPDNNKSNTKQQDNEDVTGPGKSASSASGKPSGRKELPERRRRARARERKLDKRMSNRGGGETSAAAGPGGPRDRERGPPPPRGGSGRYLPPPPHYRDGFGRGIAGGPPPPHRNEYDYPPPPGGPGYYNNHRGPPPMRHRGRGGGAPPPHYREGGGVPPGRWERDRGNPNSMNALPPHPRGSRRGGRPRSPPPRHRIQHLHRDDRHYQNRNRRHEDDRHPRENIRHRSRRGRSHESESSRNYSSRSRSRSRSCSSHGSSSSFSSSDDESRSSGGSSRHSDGSQSRSPSRSRSRSHSRSPSPHSSVGNNSQKEREKDDAIVDQHKLKDDAGNKDKGNLAKIKGDEVKKTDGEGSGSPSSSKGSTTSHKSNKGAEKRSRSRSRSTSQDSRGRSCRRGRERKRKITRKNNRSSDIRSSRSLSRSHSPASSVSRSHTPASLSCSTSSSHHSRERRRERRSKRRRKRQHHGSASRADKHPEDEFTKDQRTIFVSQLVMRTTERDLKRFFKKKVGCKVNDVILLRDRRNARNHKGCAYVEVGRIEDVATALGVSGQPPDFQRFPILVKASEAEKNYMNPVVMASATNNTINTSANLMTKTDGLVGFISPGIAVTPSTNSYANNTSSDQEKQASLSISYLPPLRDENGRLIESQKVYVGGLDPSAREDHLYALFSQFGTLQKVQLQYHPNTQISRGYAFLAFRDPKVSNLAIRTMAGKFVAGRPLKTGWANQNQQSPASIASGCTVVTSEQFPEDASDLVQKALSVLVKMTGGTMAAVDQEVTDALTMGASNSTSGGSNALALAEQELDKAMGFADTATATYTSARAIPTVSEARARMAAGGAGSLKVLGATVADARASLAADMAARQLAAATSAAAEETRAAATAKLSFIGNTDNGPTVHLLVHNMYDKDEETEEGWETEIKEEFLDECSKFGKIVHAKVMHKEPGGQIYATFADLEGAKTCVKNLAGRWFDKRQLRVDYMPEANPP